MLSFSCVKMADDEIVYPNSPTANWNCGLDFYCLDWEEHTVDSFETPDLVHKRVTELREGGSIWRMEIFDYGAWAIRFRRACPELLRVPSVFQSEQRKLARLICERQYAARLEALSEGVEEDEE
ncbi:ferrochelatase 2 [Striga asiatica]|uniref:Ferrochelatase 2 n=1 Tax=Striga asiatica TaxID=4170 RepID=A0A5A7QYX9_STRAF|nr:ferrochelatase 2 [Striga asiatica]